ncbi:MAG: PD40 domain-containing protein [Saprospiraceae bacterium]|nr:PD40 domain-containing protein [Saprospiraceae bacterium]
MFRVILILILGIVGISCKSNKSVLFTQQDATFQDTLRYPQEKHLKNIRQLTFGGDNAEAYWSFDDKKLVFQATNKFWGVDCDQIFYFDLEKWKNDSKVPPMLSTGKGRTTCSFFMPGNNSVVYASTHEDNASCPHVPERREDGKYIWPIYSSFDIYHGDLKGNIIKKLTNTEGYDAEATVSPKGDKIVFTSLRSGDLELYTMNIDGSNVKQITDELGYDGGAFFSPDGSKIIFRASRPKTEEDKKVYRELLALGQVMPTEMELFVCNADGSDLRQLTKLGKANWAPYFHPSGKKVIFSSNHASSRGYQFNLYMINLDGTGLEQITYDGVFDAFPMFSYDGKRIVFSSNRNNGGTRDTNLFMADWVD